MYFLVLKKTWAFFFLYHGFYKNIKQHNVHIKYAPNQHIKMISEGSCNTGDCSNGC